MNQRTVRQAGLALSLALASCVTTAAWAATAASNDAPPEVISGQVNRLRGTFMTKGLEATMKIPGGGIITFFSDTEASLLTDPQGLMLLPGKKLRTYSVILRKGRVEVTLPDTKSPSVAVAVGTRADTRIITMAGHTLLRAAAMDVTVLTYNGLTTVTQGTRMMRLLPGIKRTYVGKSGTLDHPLAPATPWIGGKQVWLAAGGTAKVSGYVWTQVPSASGYQATLIDDVTNQVLLSTRVTETNLKDPGVEVKPGQYQLQITTIDGDGFPSPESRSLALRVIGVSLPPGASLQQDGSIALGAEQQVSLTHAEGLTLTTADHRGNVPATSPFGLERQDRASILVHAKTGGQPTMLTLVRREPLVKAWVGPKLVTWPLDPVELRIDLSDDRGKPLSPEIQPEATVMVGVQPVHVDWQRSDSTWRASLPPQSGQGPWVVRLEVRDQYGVLIGRDFVEVAKSLPQRSKSPETAPTNPFDDLPEF